MKITQLRHSYVPKSVSVHWGNTILQSCNNNSLTAKYYLNDSTALISVIALFVCVSSISEFQLTSAIRYIYSTNTELINCRFNRTALFLKSSNRQPLLLHLHQHLSLLRSIECQSPSFLHSHVWRRYFQAPHGMNVKILRWSHVHQEIMCLKGKAAIYSARLLSVSRQIEAHPWHEGPAGALSGI